MRLLVRSGLKAISLHRCVGESSSCVPRCRSLVQRANCAKASGRSRTKVGPTPPLPRAPENFWRTVPNVVGTASGRPWRAGDLLGLVRPTIHTNSLDRYNGASRVWHLQGVFEGFRRSGERKCSRRWHKKATWWLNLTSRKRRFVTGVTPPIVDFCV